jgi:hypothetical protein
MVRRKTFANLAFNLSLAPKKEFGAKLQGKLWQNLLGSAFRSTLGKSEVDHVVTGAGGESHVQYDDKGITLIAYDNGSLDLTDSEFSRSRASEMEKLLSAFFQVVNRTTNRKVTFTANARLHMMLADRSLKKFLDDNIQFRAAPKLRRALGDYKGVKSVLLGMSENQDMVVHSPDHIDFLYHSVIKSDLKRKLFVVDFVTVSMKRVDSMRRFAQ